jgi:hypothetical protein
VKLGNRIFALGGVDNDNPVTGGDTIEEYLVSSNTWQLLPEKLPRQLMHFAVLPVPASDFAGLSDKCKGISYE